MGMERLLDHSRTAVVGTLTLAGGIEVVKRTVEYANSIAPSIERHLGIIASGVVEYGYPAVAGLVAVSAIYTATKATDKYLLERRV